MEATGCLHDGNAKGLCTTHQSHPSVSVSATQLVSPALQEVGAVFLLWILIVYIFALLGEWHVAALVAISSQVAGRSLLHWFGYRAPRQGSTWQWRERGPLFRICASVVYHDDAGACMKWAVRLSRHVGRPSPKMAGCQR